MQDVQFIRQTSGLMLLTKSYKHYIKTQLFENFTVNRQFHIQRRNSNVIVKNKQS